MEPLACCGCKAHSVLRVPDATEGDLPIILIEPILAELWRYVLGTVRDLLPVLDIAATEMAPHVDDYNVILIRHWDRKFSRRLSIVNLLADLLNDQ